MAFYADIVDERDGGVLVGSRAPDLAVGNGLAEKLAATG